LARSWLTPFPRLIPAHFCKPWKPTVSFIGLAKTSYTDGTLCAIALKFVEKILTKMRKDGIYKYYEEFNGNIRRKKKYINRTIV
jgi:hypothetical protein